MKQREAKTVTPNKRDAEKRPFAHFKECLFARNNVKRKQSLRIKGTLRSVPLHIFIRKPHPTPHPKERENVTSGIGCFSFHKSTLEVVELTVALYVNHTVTHYLSRSSNLEFVLFERSNDDSSIDIEQIAMIREIIP